MSEPTLAATTRPKTLRRQFTRKASALNHIRKQKKEIEQHLTQCTENLDLDSLSANIADLETLGDAESYIVGNFLDRLQRLILLAALFVIITLYNIPISAAKIDIEITASSVTIENSGNLSNAVDKGLISAQVRTGFDLHRLHWPLAGIYVEEPNASFDFRVMQGTAQITHAEFTSDPQDVIVEGVDTEFLRFILRSGELLTRISIGKSSDGKLLPTLLVDGKDTESSEPDTITVLQGANGVLEVGPLEIDTMGSPATLIFAEENVSNRISPNLISTVRTGTISFHDVGSRMISGPFLDSYLVIDEFQGVISFDPSGGQVQVSGSGISANVDLVDAGSLVRRAKSINPSLLEYWYHNDRLSLLLAAFGFVVATLRMAVRKAV